MTAWYLYLIRCSDNRLYTGITTDIERRFAEHQAGKGAKALRGQRELSVVFSQLIGSHSLALRTEYRIKKLRKIDKERLVNREANLNDLLPWFENSDYNSVKCGAYSTRPGSSVRTSSAKG